MDIGAGNTFKIYLSKKIVFKQTNTYNWQDGSVDTFDIYKISKSNIDNIINLIKNTKNDINEQYNNSSSITDAYSYYVLTYKNETFYIVGNEKINILEENLNRKD